MADSWSMGRVALLSAVAVFLLVLLASGPAAAAPADFASQVRATERRAAVRLAATERATPSDRFAYYTVGHAWKYTSVQGWAAGYAPGGLWLMYQMTGDAWWRRHASSRQTAIGEAPISSESLNLGALFFPSYARGFDLTGDPRFSAKVLEAAVATTGRYDSVVGAMRSRAGDEFNVIIDSLVKSQLLWWAADHGGPASLRDIAYRHASTTARDFLRDDGSTWQIVYYDSVTGAVTLKTTSAGYGGQAMWSRGQAWAILGFAAAYRETGDDLFLQAARRVTDRYLAELPADMVPYWDFRDPAIPFAPRDSSAAAIAASGMIDLALSEPDAADRARYAAAARGTLASLMSPAYASHGDNPALLLHGTYSMPAGISDRGLAFGDAFFLEALLRLRRLRPEGTALRAARVQASAGNASLAVDKSLATAWTAWGAQWLELDLGAVQNVGALRVALRNGDDRAARLRVATSADHRHWGRAVTTMTCGQTSGYETFDFAPRPARYVRVYFDGTTADAGDAVAEVRLYAATATATTTAIHALRVADPLQGSLRQGHTGPASECSPAHMGA
jgi:unsaturated chondroitin disaccharide hydrolase